jgi:hypothetical protein
MLSLSKHDLKWSFDRLRTSGRDEFMSGKDEFPQQFGFEKFVGKTSASKEKAT